MKKIWQYLLKYLFTTGFIIFFLTCGLIQPAYSQKTLVLGIHPFRSVGSLQKQFTPLATYLSKELDQDITLRVGSSYQEHVDAIGKDLIDIAYIGPHEYIEMVKQYGKKTLLACQETNGHSTFKGVIIAPSNSSATSLADIKGNIAFVDPHSTMGYILPSYMLLHENPEILKKQRYQFLKTHENVALGVLVGEFEAGAVKQSVFDSYKDKGLKQLGMTPAITEHLFVASSKLDKRLIQPLRQALLKLKDSPEGQKILQTIKPTITSFVPVSDSDYDSLRHIIDEQTKESLPE